MKNNAVLLGLLVGVLLLSSCASTPSMQEQILGPWNGEVQGFEVTLNFTETQVEIEGFGMQLDYTLVGDQISMEIPGQGTMTATVEIVGDQMTQTDNSSGEKNIFTRKQ